MSATGKAMWVFVALGGMGRRRSSATDVCPWGCADSCSHGQTPPLTGWALPMPPSLKAFQRKML